MGRGQRRETAVQLSRSQLRDMRKRDLGALNWSDDRRIALLAIQANRLEQMTSWPKQSEVGEEAALAAWLIAQHSPSVEQQQLFYKRMKECVDQGEASQAHLAQLEDRILVRQGQEQLYGTQSRINDKGEVELLPVADPARLSERRRAVGFEFS